MANNTVDDDAAGSVPGLREMSQLSLANDDPMQIDISDGEDERLGDEVVDPVADELREIRKMKNKGKEKARTKREERIELLQGPGFAGRLAKLSDTGDSIRAQKMIAGQIPLEPGSKNMSAVTNCLASVYDSIEMADDATRNDELVKQRKVLTDVMDKTRLGYATVCFGALNDFGRGPLLERAILNNRPINNSGMAMLRNFHNNRTLDHYSNMPMYHITLLVRRRTVKPESFGTDISAVRYPHIPWADNIKEVVKTAGPKENLAIVADGNHRATFCERLCEDAVNAYLKSANRNQNASTSFLNSTAGQVNKEDMEITKKIIETYGNWHCVVYDLDAIEASKFSDVIKLVLSENDTFFQQPDRNDVALDNLNATIAQKPENVDHILRVHRQARTHSSKVDSIFKDRPALLIYSQPYKFSALHNSKIWVPYHMSIWQPCATMIVGDYVTFMVRLMLWIASPSKGEILARSYELIHLIFFSDEEELGAIRDESLLDMEFFQNLEIFYTAHLKPAMVTFARTGLDDEDIDLGLRFAKVLKSDVLEPDNDIEIQWTKAYKTYQDEVLKWLEKWVRNKTARTEDPVKTGILDNIVPKVKFLFKNKLLYDVNLLPVHKDMPPLYSMLFVTDLAKSVSDVTAAIILLYNWFDPFIIPMHISQHAWKDSGKKKDKEQEFEKEQETIIDYGIRKPPKMFRAWIQHQIVRKQPIISTALTAEEVQRELLVEKLVKKLNGQIIVHRNTSLRHLNGRMKRCKELMKFYRGISMCETKEKLEALRADRGEEIDDEDVALEDIILALSQLILASRTAAQTFEISKGSDEFRAHHSTRQSKSKPGTLFKPDPTVVVWPKDQDLLEKLEPYINLLDLTACNWAQFPNKNLLVLKYVRHLLLAHDIREQIYMEQVFKNGLERPVFDSFADLLEPLIPQQSLWRVVRIPLDIEVEEKEVISKVHEGIMASELEKIDANLEKGLVAVLRLIEKHGTYEGQMSEIMASAATNLMLRFTEHAMWLKGAYDGVNQAIYGTIHTDTLTEYATRIVGPLPNSKKTLSVRELSEILHVENVEGVSKVAANNLLSDKVIEQWSKDEKRARKREELLTKMRQKQAPLQIDYEHPAPAPPKKQDKASAVKPSKKSTPGEPKTTNAPRAAGPSSKFPVSTKMMEVKKKTLENYAKIRAGVEFRKAGGDGKVPGTLFVPNSSEDSPESADQVKRKRTVSQSAEPVSPTKGKAHRKKPRIADNTLARDLTSGINQAALAASKAPIVLVDNSSGDHVDEDDEDDIDSENEAMELSSDEAAGHSSSDPSKAQPSTSSDQNNSSSSGTGLSFTNDKSV